MPDAAAITLTIETCFQTIRDTRMDGVPILNEALQVRLLGLRPWQEHHLATLLTPWFMNLILIPFEAGEEPVATGVKRSFRFPSGSFEFIRGEEPEIGPYWMCSLFSPVFEFADQETAEACALAALDVLFEEAEQASETEAGLQAIWRGERPDQPRPETPEAAVEAAVDEGEEPVPSARQLSRRGLLTGGLSQEVRDEP